jgi:predicted RNase H-like HicB family nuclease
MRRNKYLVIYERGGSSDESQGAYVPDLPGCISTGDSLDEVRQYVREAIHLHLGGSKAEELPFRNRPRRLIESPLPHVWMEGFHGQSRVALQQGEVFPPIPVAR